MLNAEGVSLEIIPEDNCIELNCQEEVRCGSLFDLLCSMTALRAFVAIRSIRSIWAGMGGVDGGTA